MYRRPHYGLHHAALEKRAPLVLARGEVALLEETLGLLSEEAAYAASALVMAREALWEERKEEGLEPSWEQFAEIYAFCRGVSVAAADPGAGGAEAAAAAAQDEYRRAREALMVLDLSGYWEVQTLEGEKELAIGALVAEIERRHGAAVEEVAARGPRRGQCVHVLDPYWAELRGEQGREAPRESATQAQWEEDWRDDIYYTAGGLHVFLSDDGCLGRKVRRRLNMVSTWLNDDGDGGGGDDDDDGGGGGGVDGYM